MCLREKISLGRSSKKVITSLTSSSCSMDGGAALVRKALRESRSWMEPTVSILGSLANCRFSRRMKADPNDPTQVGAPMPGMVVNVAVNAGDRVSQGQKLLTMEAMKMETTLYAERDGQVAEVLVSPGSQVDTGDLVIRWEA